MKICFSLVFFTVFFMSFERAEAQNSKGGYLFLESDKRDYMPLLRRFPNGKEYVDGKVTTKTKFHELDELMDLTAEQERSLFSSFSQMPEIAGYAYSGCHDRAHAVWQQLDDKHKSMVSKVWLMAPGMTTLAFEDFLTVSELGDDSPKWGYHVALAYKVNGETRVIDFVKPTWSKESVSLSQWLGTMNKPYGTFMTFLSPELYLFFSISSKNTSGLVSNNVSNSVATNGQFFECLGECRSKKNIEKALARDEIGLDLLNEKGCSKLKTIVKNPGQLLAHLDEEELPLDCNNSKRKFQERIEFWSNTLWSN